MISGGSLATVDSMAAQDSLAQSARGAFSGIEKQKMNGKQAEATAREFEGMFISQMLSPMWSGISTDGEFGGGAAEETFRGMLINEYGGMIAKSGGFGIADSVRAELLKMQEKKS